jgi:hypothetical protein
MLLFYLAPALALEVFAKQRSGSGSKSPSGIGEPCSLMYLGVWQGFQKRG